MNIMRNIRKYGSLLSVIVVLPLMAFYCEDWDHHIKKGEEDAIYAQEVKNRCVMRAVRSLDMVKYLYGTVSGPFRTGDYVINIGDRDYGPIHCVATETDTVWTVNRCDVRHLSEDPERWEVGFSGEVGSRGESLYEISLEASPVEERPQLPEDCDYTWEDGELYNTWKVEFSGKKTEESPYSMEFSSAGPITSGWVRENVSYGISYRTGVRITLSGPMDVTFFKDSRRIDGFRYVYALGVVDTPSDYDYD